MPDDTDLRADLCPLCGQSNRCAIEAGAPAASCWCMAVPVAPEALAAVPDALRGRACLCPACARGEGRSGAAPIRAKPPAPI